ncbi:class I SAM-dependent methyltransferase [Novipirellula sp. SH528]|uniref:class I SAM-dependent methyltransferase n=1 Tax=Novipirellula sp. SH528 TaxID=3454466 RepID=UPI003FA19719
MSDSIQDEQIVAYEAAIAELAATTPAGSDPKVAKRLRHQFGSDSFYELIAIALLQKKARQKLGDGVWWATDRALQQATAWQVAKLKSDWLGDHLVYDLCCGIGGDAIQLANRANEDGIHRHGGVVAVDMDPVILQYADANLRKVKTGAATSGASGIGQVVETVCEDVLKIEIPAAAAIHLDPDRRVGGKRTTRPEDYQPALDAILPRIEAAPAAIIKLAPAAKLDLGNATHRSWISLSGSVREQSLVFGDALRRAEMIPGAVSAIAVRSDGSISRFDSGDLSAAEVELVRAESTKSPGQWIIDPDAAIRAAGLTEFFASSYGLKTLGGPTGFLTSEGDLDHATMKKIQSVASVGEVIWSGSCDERKLRRELRRMNHYAEMIKVRGSGHDPAVLSKRFRECGETPVGLWIGRAGKGVFAAFTR